MQVDGPLWVCKKAREVSSVSSSLPSGVEQRVVVGGGGADVDIAGGIS